MITSRHSSTPSRRPDPPRAGGFTILEVVLAMGILVLAMTSLLGLFTFGAALTRTAALRTASATAIEAVIADLEESLFPLEEDGSVGDPRRIVDRPIPGAVGVVYSAVARPNPDNPDEFAVDIDASWEASGVRRTRRFTTLLLREVPFGERLRRRFIQQRSFPTSPPGGDDPEQTLDTTNPADRP